MSVDVKVPDIGDFKDVGVIEVLVKPGDTVQVEQSLITIESDKASMEIPSSHAGVVKEVKVKVGDTVNEGSPILSLEPAGQAPEARPAASTDSPAVAPAPASAAAAAPTAPAAAAPAAAAPAAAAPAAAPRSAASPAPTAAPRSLASPVAPAGDLTCSLIAPEAVSGITTLICVGLAYWMGIAVSFRRTSAPARVVG